MSSLTFFKNVIGYHPTAETITDLATIEDKEGFRFFKVFLPMAGPYEFTSFQEVLKFLATYYLDLISVSVRKGEEIFNEDEPLKHTQDVGIEVVYSL